MAAAEPIKVNWHLSPAQLAFFQDQLPASLYLGGWGSGKTFIGARKAILNSIKHPAALGLISANTHKQLHQSTLAEYWRALREDFGLIRGQDWLYSKQPPRSWGVVSRFENHDGVITFRWGAQVVTRSLSNYDPILGLTLGWAWIDEAKDAKREAFETVLSRLRDTSIGIPRLDLTGTPNGFDWMYEHFEAEPTEKPELKEQRRYHVGSTLDNADNLPASYIEQLLSSLDPQAAQQNIYAQFVDLTRGKAYHAFNREDNLSDLAAYNSGLPVYLLCDFNVDPMSWLVAQPWNGHALIGLHKGRALKFQHQVLAVIDELVVKTSSTQEVIDEFRRREYGDRPDLVTVYGDATGRTSTTIADYAIIAQAGYKRQAVPSHNPPVAERVAAVNAKLRNAAGEVGLIINPRRCPELVKDLQQVGFKPGTKILDKSDPARTHTSDALGYCIYREWPIKHPPVKVRQTGY